MSKMKNKKGLSRGKGTCEKLLPFFGILLTCTGTFLFVLWPRIYTMIVHHQITVTDNTLMFKLWKDFPVPVYMEFYFFNWTNPQDFYNSSTKPILKEIGPYVYKEIRKKIVDQRNPENDTITFRQNRTWHFEPSMSVGTEDDVITTINAAAALAENHCRHLSYWTKFVFNSAIRTLGTEHFMEVKVRDILYEGHEDPILQLASSIPEFIFPIDVPVDKLGWFYKRNGSANADGIFNMYGGVDDPQKAGKIAQWNYKNETGLYPSYCGALNGSAGELFTPNFPKTNASVFIPEFGRSLLFYYESDPQFDGIQVNRYTANEKLFGDKETNPDNWCFCKKQDDGTCPLSGLHDVSSFKWGAPAFISLPHFYLAHPSYGKNFIGLSPDKAKHETFVEIEPTLGFPIQLNAAFQINILVEEHEGFSLFEGIPKTYFPTVWFKQTARIDESLGLLIKTLITYLPLVTNVGSIVAIVIGCALLVPSLVGVVKSSSRHIQMGSNEPIYKVVDPQMMGETHSIDGDCNL